MRKLSFLLSILLMIFTVTTIVYANSEKIILSVTDASDVSDMNNELYIMNSDGGNIQKLFSFKNHPKVQIGSIYDLHISQDGKTIFFSSDNAFVYTPVSTNIFRIASDGSWIDQITPDENSGYWDKPCPCGSIRGMVKRPGSNTSWGGCPVFLEGVGMVYSKPDGSFIFKNVPSGIRFVVAYRPGSRAYDTQTVNVLANSRINVTLIPNSDYRVGFSHPITTGKRVYFKFGPNKIQWTDINASHYYDIYTAHGMCTDFPDIDGFDVNNITGQIAIMDYQEGCASNRGIYIADKNGKNLRLLLDMKSDNKFSGGGELFWSPDGNMIAAKISYNYITYIALINAKTGIVISSVPFAKSYSMFDVDLYGFSPSGRWLLFSYGSTQTNGWFLSKIKITPAGTFDVNSVVNLLKNVIVKSAAWGMLSMPPPLPKGGIEMK